eukprot:TRINITY_DN9111_c0_g2_i3.p1 TRINITY_DN9111_c0_g2~~TRINITY_DN9111_c0_g2_i3.p1  ORF type:complete len:333 (+),score=81.60 TRINITY_DN9111_c0_g2_i3:73-1071(+)
MCIRDRSKTQQISKDPQVCITTNIKKVCNTSAAAKPKETHEQMLDQDLRLYKAEVEKRFQKSEVNRSYVYPRTGVKETDIIDCYFNPTTSSFVSIYSSEMDRGRVRDRVGNKSRSQDRSVVRLNGSLHSILKKILKEKTDEVETYAKESFYSTQKIELNSQADERKTAMESYMGANILATRGNAHEELNASRKEIVHSEEPKIEEKSKELLSLLESIGMNGPKSKKKHFRTHTCNVKCIKGIKKSGNEIRGVKHPKHHKNKTKSSMKFTKETLNISLLPRGKQSGTQLTNKVLLLGRGRGRNQLTNTVNLSSFIKKCSRTYNSHSRKKNFFS